MAETEATKTSEAAGAGAGGDAGAGAMDDATRAAKILKQVDFYFSVHNMPKDKFLMAEAKKGDGWVTIETLLKFNRLKALTMDTSVVAAALAPSSVVQVKDGRVKRKEPLPENVSFDDSTIYAKGFPDSATLEDVTELFSEFGAVGRVFMRRFPGKQRRFKGSVFVTFEKKEAAAKALEGEVKFMGRPLSKVMMKTAYLELKAAERKKRDESKEGDNDGGDAVHAFTGVTRVDKGLLRINVPDMTSISQHALRDAVAAHGDLKFFDADAEGAVARFGGEGDALKAKTALEEAKTEISGQKVTFVVLEGDDATAYWDKVDEFHKSRWEEMRRRKTKGKRKRKGGYNAGRAGGAKRSRA